MFSFAIGLPFRVCCFCYVLCASFGIWSP